VNALSDQLRQSIAALCPEWDLADVSGFIYLEGGYSNDNYRFEYRGERYVLRIPFVTRSYVDRDLEQRLYGGSHGVPVPPLVALDVDSGQMISRWVPGTLLADAHPDGTALAQYLRGLHDGLPAMQGRHDPLVMALEHLENAAAPAWVESLAASLTWSPETESPCHNDLNPWNVICTADGTWVTLDWEWAGLNDPLFDLITLHQGAGMHAATLTELSRRYLGTAAAPDRLQRCLTVFWLRETAWAMAEIAAGNDRPEVVEQQRLGLERLQDCGSDL
jgi:aminoglycoside phosphotransferase (APT) family kinase protein